MNKDEMELEIEKEEKNCFTDSNKSIDNEIGIESKPDDLSIKNESVLVVPNVDESTFTRRRLKKMKVF